MKIRFREYSSQAGFTWLELLVLVAILAILMSLGTVCGPPIKNAKMMQTLQNMKQLHLATQSLALDGTTTGNTNLGWPGDHGATFSNWATLLSPEYLSKEDLRKLLSAPGLTVGKRDPLTSNSTAVLVYAAKEESAGDVVFLSSANFTNTPQGGLALQSNSIPFGTDGFVVFRKAGDGSILKANQVGLTNLIGGYARPLE